jgi:hypothetical protein
MPHPFEGRKRHMFALEDELLVDLVAQDVAKRVLRIYALFEDK